MRIDLPTYVSLYFSKSLVVRILIFSSLKNFFLIVCIYQGGKVYESGIGCILSRELVPSHLVDLSTNNSSSIFALWIRILWITIAWKILLTENKQTSLIEYYYEHKHVPFHLVVLLTNNPHPFRICYFDKRLPKAKRT